MCTWQPVRIYDAIAKKVTHENAGNCKYSKALQKLWIYKINYWLTISSTLFSKGGQAFLLSVIDGKVGLMRGKVRVTGKWKATLVYVLPQRILKVDNSISGMEESGR